MNLFARYLADFAKAFSKWKARGGEDEMICEIFECNAV